MFISRGASIPTRTLLGPIRTKVTTTSSPTRIRSPAFRDSTSMISCSLTFLFSKLPCIERVTGLTQCQPPSGNHDAIRRRFDTDVRMIQAAQGTPSPKTAKIRTAQKTGTIKHAWFLGTRPAKCQNGTRKASIGQNYYRSSTDRGRNWATTQVWSKCGPEVARIKKRPQTRFRAEDRHLMTQANQDARPDRSSGLAIHQREENYA